MKGYRFVGLVGLVSVLATVLLLGSGCESSSSSSSRHPLAGTWRLVSVTDIESSQTVTAEDLGFSLSLELRQDGSATATTLEDGFSDVEHGTWSSTDNMLTLTFDGEVETWPYTRNGNDLRITIEGMVFLFRR